VLTMTKTASEALEAYTSAADVPEEGGVRIVYGSRQDGSPALRLTLAEQPGPQDAVLPAKTFSLFLEPQAAALLDDKVLDAEIDATGQFGFVIAEQT
jgi:iron-sulfur cluster assembly protein